LPTTAVWELLTNQRSRLLIGKKFPQYPYRQLSARDYFGIKEVADHYGVEIAYQAAIAFADW
jgi:hypothetical protein